MWSRLLSTFLPGCCVPDEPDAFFASCFCIKYPLFGAGERPAIASCSFTIHAVRHRLDEKAPGRDLPRDEAFQFRYATVGALIK